MRPKQLTEFPIPTCSTSVRERRELLWKPEEVKPEKKKVKAPKMGGLAWRAIAYIIVSVFTAAAGVVGTGLAADQIEDLYDQVERGLDDVLG